MLEQVVSFGGQVVDAAKTFGGGLRGAAADGHVDGAIPTGDGTSTPALPICRILQKAPWYWHGNCVNSSAWEDFLRVYALNATMLEEGFVPGDSSKMARLLRKIDRREEVRIVIYGGSFAVGSGCAETPEHETRQCAWANRLKLWWQAILPDSAATFINKAFSGVSSKVFLDGIGPTLQELKREPPDLILLDFVVNNLQQMPPAEMLPIEETTLRLLLEHLPETQLITFQDGCPRCLGWVNEAGKQVAPYYGVPVIDFHSIAQRYNKEFPQGPDRLWPSKQPPYDGASIIPGSRWPDFSPEVWVIRKVCCADLHPPWVTHQYYADLVGYALLKMLGDVCQHKSQPARVLSEIAYLSTEAQRNEAKPVCVVPRAVYDARAPNLSADLPIPQSAPEGSWVLQEDKPGRPGWIATRKGSAIRFRVRFGPQATLVVTYLRSYEGVGTAMLSLHPVGKEGMVGEHTSQRVDAKWDSRFSVPYTHLLTAGGSPIVAGLNQTAKNEVHNGSTSGHESYNEYDLVVTKLEDKVKFKIISVISC